MKNNKYDQERRREAIAYMMDEMSIKEIAEVADVSTKTVRSDIKYIEEHWNDFFN